MSGIVNGKYFRQAPWTRSVESVSCVIREVNAFNNSFKDISNNSWPLSSFNLKNMNTFGGSIILSWKHLRMNLELLYYFLKESTLWQKILVIIENTIVVEILITNRINLIYLLG